MARSKIPYASLEAELQRMLTNPTYIRVRLLRPTRYNEIKAPTTMYDRTTGNYAKYGYLCDVQYDVFKGFMEDFEGKLVSVYQTEVTKMVIPVSF